MDYGLVGGDTSQDVAGEMRRHIGGDGGATAFNPWINALSLPGRARVRSEYVQEVNLRLALMRYKYMYLSMDDAVLQSGRTPSRRCSQLSASSSRLHSIATTFNHTNNIHALDNVSGIRVSTTRRSSVIALPPMPENFCLVLAATRAAKGSNCGLCWCVPRGAIGENSH